MKNFTAVVERDPDTGIFVGYVPGLPGAHSQSESLDELRSNLKEVIELLLEQGEPDLPEAEGSHKVFRHKRTTTVPFHRGRDISPTLLRQICKDIGMTPEEFLQHR